MKNNDVYVLSAKQVSIQQPLSEDWMEQPIFHEEPYVRSLDPDFKKYVSPIEARRMGKILKRALATSKEAIADSGLETVDAIVTGTGYGCVENTEFFLDALCKEGEQLLKPTFFMQSTHNTISSLIAIQTKNHSFNATYAHKSISFDSALHDAWLQFCLGKINSALVGGHDEMTPVFYHILKRGDVMGKDNEICGEAAVSVVLGRNAEKSLCKLSGMRVLYHPTIETLSKAVAILLKNAEKRIEDVDFVLTGISGHEESDQAYLAESETLFGKVPLLKYKHLFGESFTASGLGFYVAAQCLKAGKVPAHLFVNQEATSEKQPHCILLYNRSDGKNFTLTLLEK
jgi:3-oxoacyl-(acyl-carrier-protein) synthase